MTSATRQTLLKFGQENSSLGNSKYCGQVKVRAMAMQVHACCKSSSAALWARGVPTESSGGSLPTSSSYLARSKSGSFGVSGGRAVGEARTRVGERGGAVVVRARTGRPSGKDESKAVYDAFFLGKALAEAVNERVGSAIGEFLSDIGRRQAEQQKRIREFQDEVQERAAATALKAAQKALATEKEEKEEKENVKPPTAPPPPSPSPKQPPLSTSGLSNPDDAPPSI